LLAGGRPRLTSAVLDTVRRRGTPGLCDFAEWATWAPSRRYARHKEAVDRFAIELCAIAVPLIKIARVGPLAPSRSKRCNDR